MTVSDRAVETLDVEMLRIMAAEFRQGRVPPFNQFNMAELMERCADAAVSGQIEIGGTDERHVLILEKQDRGGWCLSRGAGRIAAIGKTPADALRGAARLLEDIEALTGAAQGDQP